MAPAIEITGLGKRYRLGDTARATRITEAAVNLARRSVQRRRSARAELWALRNVDLAVPQGQALGVIGRNGSGKSTLLKILARITEPTEGRVVLHGRVGALIELGTGFHPELTGRENVFLNGAILGMTRAEIKRKFDGIAEFSEIEEFLDTPVKRYSSGMIVRLAFAVAAHLEPEILLIDEVLAVGDADFQRRCLGRMDEIRRGGRTLLFVSHNTGAIESLCERAVWLDRGQVMEDGPASDTVRSYLRNRSRLGQAVWRPEPAAPDPTVDCREVRVLGRDGTPALEFDRSEPVLIEFEVEVKERDPRLRVGFDIANQEGLVAFSTSHADAEGGEAALEPGRHVLRAQIPAQLLNFGLYSVHARIHLHQVRWIVHTDDVLQFEVRSPGGELGQRPGLVLPAVEWSREAAPSSAPLVSTGRDG